MLLVVLPDVLLLVLSSEHPITPHTTELTLHLLQTTHPHVILHDIALASHPTEIGALQGEVDTHWPVCVHHHLIGGFEVTVLTHTVSLHTLHGHVLLQLVLGDGLQAIERTLDVHMLAVVLVWVQVSI